MATILVISGEIRSAPLNQNFQNINDEVTGHLADTTPHFEYVVQKSGDTMTGPLFGKSFAAKGFDPTGLTGKNLFMGYYVSGDYGAILAYDYDLSSYKNLVLNGLVTIISSGLGIGGSPGERLHVFAPGAGELGLRLQTSGALNDTNIIKFADSHGSYAGIKVTHTDVTLASEDAKMEIFVANGLNHASYDVYSQTPDITITDRKVGIGGVPSVKFEVFDAARVDQGAYRTQDNISSGYEIAAQYYYAKNSVNIKYNFASMLIVATNVNQGSEKGAIQFVTKDNGIQYIPFVIEGNKVGINNTNPQWMLDVGSGWVNSVSGYKTNGADYGEYFESVDGQKIPFGATVVLEGDKVRPAKPGETPVGVSSATCSWVGNNGGSEWPRKFLRNELGEEITEEYQEEVMVQKKELVTKERPVTFTCKAPTVTHEVREIDGKFVQVAVKGLKEEVITLCDEYPLYDEAGKLIGTHKVPHVEEYTEEILVTDEQGRPVMVGTGEFVSKKRPILNPEFDPSKGAYAKREDRPEWNVIALMGQGRVLKGQPVAPGWVKMKDISDTVELWLIK